MLKRNLVGIALLTLILTVSLGSVRPITPTSAANDLLPKVDVKAGELSTFVFEISGKETIVRIFKGKNDKGELIGAFEVENFFVLVLENPGKKEGKKICFVDRRKQEDNLSDSYIISQACFQDLCEYFDIGHIWANR